MDIEKEFEKEEEEEVYDPNMDDILRKCVELIWDDYDKDGNGVLDIDECKDFLMSAISEIGESKDFLNKDFEKCFKMVDTDGSGNIDKEEMFQFIKIVANNK